ncbi:MAG: hypothetical protein QW767_06635 [Thermoprotei archaeon]
MAEAGQSAPVVDGFEQLTRMVGANVLGDNTTAAAALSWLSTHGVEGNIVDLLGFCDEFLLRDRYFVEELPRGHVLRTHTGFFDANPEFRDFFQPFRYSDQINRERWDFVRLFARNSGKSLKWVFAKTLRSLRENRLYNAATLDQLFLYSRTEIPDPVFEAVEKAVRLNERSDEQRLLPQVVRALANAAVVTAAPVGYRFQYARDAAVDHALEVLKGSGELPKAPGLQRSTVEEVVGRIRSFSYPSIPAFAAAAETEKPWEEAPQRLLELRDKMKDVRVELARLGELASQNVEEAKLKADEISRIIEEKTEEDRLPLLEQFRVHRLLKVLYVAPAEVVTYMLLHSPALAGVVASTTLADSLPEISRALRRRSLGKKFGLNLLTSSRRIANPADYKAIQKVMEKMVGREHT